VLWHFGEIGGEISSNALESFKLTIDVDDNAAQGVSVRNAASAIAATLRFLFREGRNAQHINTIPRKGARLPAKIKTRSAEADLP